MKGLEANIAKSRDIKEGILGILAAFEKRLEGLDATINPLYQETHRLQTQEASPLPLSPAQPAVPVRALPDIAKTLKTVNTRIEFYSIADEMDTTIRENELVEVGLKAMAQNP